MSRRRGRANLRTGLWQDLPGEGFVAAEDLPDELATSPLLRECPHCHAAPRQPCTAASHRRGGRRQLRGYHDSRKTPTSQENP
ncbi:hypothetical protein ACFWIW_10895 [Amycolatopsis sp. NPDC058340]|uniref:zinc finger domain-containing protein n=1 Tax=Amycolatopsis sp. NPDC058340 TaxID=3346453 RepID=UPI00364A1CB2